jgi:WD40 repeat protein
MPRYRCKLKGHEFEANAANPAYDQIDTGEVVCYECGSWAVRIPDAPAPKPRPPAPSKPPARQLRTIELRNRTGQAVKIYWLNPQGKRVYMTTLAAGKGLKTPFPDAPLVVTDEADRVLRRYNPDSGLDTIDIEPVAPASAPAPAVPPPVSASAGAAPGDGGLVALLRTIIQHHGRRLCDEPDRLKALLRDYLGSNWEANRRGVNVLMNALEERAVTELLGAAGQTPDLLRRRISVRLQNELSLTPEAADWAVDAWGAVLELWQPRPPAPVAQKPTPQPVPPKPPIPPAIIVGQPVAVGPPAVIVGQPAAAPNPDDWVQDLRHPPAGKRPVSGMVAALLLVLFLGNLAFAWWDSGGVVWQMGWLPALMSWLIVGGFLLRDYGPGKGRALFCLGGAMWASWFVIAKWFPCDHVHVDNYSRQEVALELNGRPWVTVPSGQSVRSQLRPGTYELVVRSAATREVLDRDIIAVAQRERFPGGRAQFVLNVLGAQTYLVREISYKRVAGGFGSGGGPKTLRVIRDRWFQAPADYVLEPAPASISSKGQFETRTVLERAWKPSADWGRHTITRDPEGRSVTVLEPHGDAAAGPRDVVFLAFAPDGSTLVYNDGQTPWLRLWDLRGREPVELPPVYLEDNRGPSQSPALSATFSPSGRWLAVDLGSQNATETCLFERIRGAFVPRKLPAEGICRQSFFLDDQRLGLVMDNGPEKSVELWDIAGAEPVKRATLTEGLFVGSPAVSPDGKLAALSTHDAIRLWDAQTATYIRQIDLRGFTPDGLAMKHLVFSPDGRTLLGMVWRQRNEYFLQRWDCVTSRPLGSLTQLPEFFFTVLTAYSPERQLLATVEKATDTTRNLGVWQATGEKAQRMLTQAGHENTVCVKFSPDGKMLATGHVNGSVRLWELRGD